MRFLAFKWSYWSQPPGDEMLSFVRDHVFHFLRNMGSDGTSFSRHMLDAVRTIRKTSMLQFR